MNNSYMIKSISVITTLLNGYNKYQAD